MPNSERVLVEPRLTYQNGFFVLDGVKLFKRCLRTGKLEWHDKDPYRSERRGSAFVTKDPQEFINELLSLLGA